VRARVRKLGTGVAIYGAGDAALALVSFLLLPIYVKGGYLTEADYGALALLVALETFAKVLCRFGLDGAFMRFYHEGDSVERRRMASTICWFLVATNVLVLGAALAGSAAIAQALFDLPGYLMALRLMLVNTLLSGIVFLPFHAMRLEDRATTYATLTFIRSIATIGLRVALVIGAGLGVVGLYAADLVVTALLLPALWPWLRPLVGFTFSRTDLGRALRFGLPRVPHGIAQQVLDGGNKLLLAAYIPQSRLGVYQNGTTLGGAIKFFTAAFETAWAPFYYATARQPDAREVFRKITTYGIAALALLVAGTVAVSRDVVLLVLSPEYLEAVPVVPFIAFGMAAQGVYLLTSIGLNLTSRTEFYPVATSSAAAVGLGSGVILMPLWGPTGAAVAFALSFLTQAAVAFVFAQRVYPMTYEAGRIARVFLAAAAGVLAAATLIPEVPPLAGFLARGTLTVLVFAGVLWMTGFLRQSERAVIADLERRWRARLPGAAEP
jgi:O-antigen/teichoic acid export membrane protein